MPPVVEQPRITYETIDNQKIKSRMTFKITTLLLKNCGDPVFLRPEYSGDEFSASRPRARSLFF
jgi:hypothetical protein